MYAEKKDTQAESTVQRHNNPRPADVRPKSFPNLNKANRTNQPKKGRNQMSGNRESGHQIPSPAATAEALVANTNQTSKNRFYDQCRYCNKRHWSDERTKYSTIEERKKQLKDRCLNALKLVMCQRIVKGIKCVFTVVKLTCIIGACVHKNSG